MIEVLNSKLEYVFEDNKNEKTFVFIHGFSSFHQKFTHRFKETITQKGYNYLAFNLPGHGNSIAEDEEINYKYFVGVAAELIKVLGLKKVTLFGHSMGGGIALALNNYLEKQVETTIVVGPVSRWPKERKEFLAKVFSAQDFEGLKVLANLLYYFGEHVFMDPNIKEQALKELEAFKQDPKRVHQMRLLIKQLLEENEVEDLIEEGIKKAKKLHLVYGEGDRVVDQETIKDYFHKFNSETKITVLERCGHSPWEEDQEGFIEFLKQAL